MRDRKIAIFLIITIVFSLLFISLNLVRASTSEVAGIIYVNTERDEWEDNGFCSLREAIQAANMDMAFRGCSAGNGQDTIVVGTGTYVITSTGVITGEDTNISGDFDILDDVIIQGEGQGATIIDGNHVDRVFHVDPELSGVQVEIRYLTIQNGLAPINDSLGGGGVLSEGDLTLRDVTIQDNDAFRGGGVRTSIEGEIYIDGAEISGNIAHDEGGGFYGDGPLRIVGSIVRSNTAVRGGGIFCDAEFTISSSSVRGNTANIGGGIYSDANGQILQSTIKSNIALGGGTTGFGSGGGIYNEKTIYLENITVSDNFGLRGGGIFSSGSTQLIHGTIADNQSTSNGGGIYRADDALFEIANSIVSDNSFENCNVGLVSLGHNIEYHSASEFEGKCMFNSDGDFLNSDPRLGPLQNNGGATETYAPATNSPAIDSASSEYCPIADQRGAIRPIDSDQDGTADCEIGAYELAIGGLINFVEFEYDVPENQSAITISVVRTDGSSGPVSVDYYLKNGSGAAGAYGGLDYVYTSGTLHWADGDMSTKTFQVSIIDDLAREPDETVILEIGNSQGGSGILGVVSTADLIIEDDDFGQPTATPIPSDLMIYLITVQR